MENKLTNKTFWKEYWHNYKFSTLPSKSFYHNYLPQKPRNSKFIEIGGFPGINAVYFYKHVCDDITILDYHIEPTIIRKIESDNHLPSGTIQFIESDLFEFTSKEKYDIVFSLGFIEHFENTEEVIKKHVDLLQENGDLLIILPNFKGLNGFIQYVLDKENLHIHNLKCMDKKFLKSILEKLGLKNIKVEYNKKPMVWLEPKPGFINKTGRIVVKGMSYLIKLFPLKSKFLSPYIILSATK